MATLDRDGVGLYYEDKGTGDPALLLVHGWSGDHTHFAPQSMHFASARRVVSVDLRGFGASDAPEQDYEIPGFADDLAWLCGRLEVSSVVVAGHSMGGSVSIALAAAHPDLVRGVVLVDSPLVWPPGFQPLLRQGAEAMAGPAGDTARRTLIDGFFIPQDDPDLRAQLTEQMMRTPARVAASAFHSIASWDLAEAATHVKAPVLAILADGMPLSPEQHFPAGIVESLTIGRTVGSGHYAQLAVPDQVNAMIGRFLNLIS